MFFGIENVKSKPFFIINNSYASNFILYNILIILESFLSFAKHFYTKTFTTQTFEKCIMSSIFFQILKPFPDGVYSVKTMET